MKTSEAALLNKTSALEEMRLQLTQEIERNKELRDKTLKLKAENEMIQTK